MLVGRDRELDRIVETLTAARHGGSGVLVVSGEPGIGKTALLNTALDGVADALVLRVVGTEIKSEITYVGLGDLFRSVADRLTSLPTRQAKALASAMALGPVGDRRSICGLNGHAFASRRAGQKRSGDCRR